jgi:uncharacterized protein (DUF58 family)
MTPPLRLAWTSAPTGRVECPLPPIAPGCSHAIQLHARIDQRGIDIHPRCMIEVSDSLGLVARSSQIAASARLVAHPSPMPFRVPIEPARAGAARNRPTPTSTEAEGVRPWRPGDERRAINWRASARANQVLVRSSQAPDRRAVWIVPVADQPTDCEPAIARAAGAALVALAKGFEVAVSNSDSTPWRIGTRIGAHEWAAELPADSLPSSHAAQALSSGRFPEVWLVCAAVDTSCKPAE